LGLVAAVALLLVSPPLGAEARLKLRKTFHGPISPKSVASSGTGLVLAQNMMYRHTISIYDARRLRPVKTLSDRVRRSLLGRKGRGTARGAPVEAAFSPDGRYAYVSNYSMYGPGFGPQGHDNCSPASGYDRSFLYRVDLRRLRIDKAYRVGSVPKVVAVTPDGRFVLVSNWCSFDLSVVSVRKGRQVRRIPIGRHPRGIAVVPDGSAAYVAVMGSSHLVRVDLRRWNTSTIHVGPSPRAVVTGRSGRYLYVSLNGAGRVVKVDRRRRRVVASATTGSQPRSLAIAPDRGALYVVNYVSGTLSKLRTTDLRVQRTLPACFHAIGITYDVPTRRVWVACYRGSIRVYDDH
jgi:DNA-binding beta-propeller fold protein YncE